jgi:hypothetical protein
MSWSILTQLIDKNKFLAGPGFGQHKEVLKRPKRLGTY